MLNFSIKYKSLIDKVKSDYFSREADDLKADMQQLAPRVKVSCAYCERCYVRIQSKKRSKNILIFLIMSILHYKF